MNEGRGRTESLYEERELLVVCDELVDLSARMHAGVLDACDAYRSHGSGGEQKSLPGDNRRGVEQRTKGVIGRRAGTRCVTGVGRCSRGGRDGW